MNMAVSARSSSLSAELNAKLATIAVIPFCRFVSLFILKILSFLSFNSKSAKILHSYSVIEQLEIDIS
jgi:hypothetical protein